ncbi:MAG: TIGR01777 family oxidoreductase [Chthonomonadales bacterium]
MRVLVAGSRGFVGSALARELARAGHSVLGLTRGSPSENEAHWDPSKGELDLAQLMPIHAVVNLAGESIAGGRWSAQRKERILKSRTAATGLLASTAAGLNPKPRVFLSASAVGYYGDRGDEILTEESPPGRGFLAEVCRQWEASCAPARSAGIPVAVLRLGVVLASEGGALDQMLLPFRRGVGGILGTGKQYMSWITLADAVSAMLHLLEGEGVDGAYNLCAPNPVTNAEFARTAARVLRRPAWVRVPGFVLRLMLGEMAQEMLLSSTRAVPARLLQRGFAFRHPQLEEALAQMLGRGPHTG